MAEAGWSPKHQEAIQRMVAEGQLQKEKIKNKIKDSSFFCTWTIENHYFFQC